MKKHNLLAIVLGALVLPLMVSCTKPDDGGSGNSDNPGNPITPIDPINPINPNTPEDIMGVYNPGKKIRKVFYKSPYSDRKELKESWQWENNLLVSRKCYDWNGDIDHTEQFIYDGQRLSRIEYADWLDRRGYVDFKYENDKLNSAEWHGSCDDCQCKLKFINQEGKLSKIIYQSDYVDVSMQFTWSNGNVSTISIIGYGDNDYDNNVELYYDQNNNPYKGFINYCMGLEYLEKDDLGFLTYRSSFSLNNVTKAVSSDQIRNFVYQYDEDGFPTEQQCYDYDSEYSGTYYYVYDE